LASGWEVSAAGVGAGFGQIDEGFGAHLWVQVKIKNSKWGVSASMIWVFWNLVVLPVD